MTPAGWDTYFERLGPLGLHCLLTILLDEEDVARFVERDVSRLDPAERARLLADRLLEDRGLRASLLTRLDERARDVELDPPPEKWDAGRIREQLARMLRDPGEDAARVLHRLARAGESALPASELRAVAEIVAPVVREEETGTRPKYVAKVASDRAGMRELTQQRRELEERVRQLESQLSRAVEHTATLEGKLAQRLEEQRKERASDKELRDERQRLEKEVGRLTRRMEDLNERRARERTGEITTALRRLTTEQRRTHATLDKIGELGRSQVDAFRGHGRELERLNELLERMLTLQESASRTGAAAQEAILLQLASLRATLGGGENGHAAEKTDAKAQRSSNGKPRVGVFVDVQNMFYGAREKGARLDFDLLLAAATSGRQLVRAVAYLVEAPEIDQRAFIHLLQMKAYEVKRKPLRIRPDRTMKGNWDLEMALDALTTSEHLDVVVLATGDGDFVPLVRQLKLRGLRVEIYGFTKSSAPDLREAADRFVPITRRLLRSPDASRTRRKKKAPARRKRARRPESAAGDDASPGA